MKKILFVLFAIFSFTKLCAQGFTVENYTVDIYINQEGYFDVVENYDLNFSVRKHGIYRKIQINYDLLTSKGEKEKRNIEISHIEVPDHKFEMNPKIFRKIEGNINIKIGDPDFTVIGPQHYQIKYRVAKAFLHEEKQTHFYWNIKPEAWFASFNNITFKIHVPENIALSDQNCFVYSGPRGNTSISKDFNVGYHDGTFEGTSVDRFQSLFGDSVTILMNLPAGSIKEIKPPWPFWAQYGWTLIIGLLITTYYLLWVKFGKDTKVISTTSYYPPKDIDPAMAGFLINDSSDTGDLISLIPYWGAQGLLKVEEIPKKGWFVSDDTKLTKLKPLSDKAPRYQKELFNGLFKKGDDILVNSLKDSFYTTMNLARIYLKETGQRYYEKKSRKAKRLLSIILAILPTVLFPLMLYFWGLAAGITAAVVCIILLIFNTYMIKKNLKGDAVFSELKGFKQFIKVAEKNKLKILLQENPNYFEATMGYALAFGFFEKWTKKFEALNTQPPSWFSSTSGHAFSMTSFSQSFSSSMNTTQSNLVSSPSSSSSSGGGSSGGGFGGGGGGSW